MATASGLAVANLYYNQPMLADMARSFGVGAREIGLVATATQVGYAVGMSLFVPLGDFTERRRLVVLLFIAVGIALAGAAAAPSLPLLIGASFLIGVTSVTAQILIPLATELTPPAEQGRTIGAVLSGILLGILLARTVSGVVSGTLNWRWMFGLASAVSFASAIGTRAKLPHVPARTGTDYRELMLSMWRIVRELPKLRQVSLVAALFFAAFSAFWTTLVFRLEAPPYHYGSEAAGLFGLVGAVSAAVAPVAGRLADRRTPRFVVGLAIIIVFVSFAVFAGFSAHLWGLVAGVLLLDAGIQGAQVANQSRVLSLRPEARSRVNTVYMICYFGGGSTGSLLGSWAWTRWQWAGVCGLGMALMLAAWIALVSRGPMPDSPRPA